MRHWIAAAMAGLFIASVSFSALADEVILKNGDHLTGTIGQIAGGTLNFTSPVLGSLVIKLTDIESYKTDKPATVQLNNGKTFSSPIVSGSTTQVTTADSQTTPMTAVKSVNPPAEAWTGAVILNAALARGNTNTATVGFSASATLRRNNPSINDRTILGADYNYGDNGRGSHTATTTDNADANAEYNYFFDPKLYGYGNAGYLHDRIAGVTVRLTPGVGVGYQWVEQPNLNFNTEGGATYVYEDLQDSGVDQKEDLRLAYHVDAHLNPNVAVFQDTEYLAAVSDPADYLINADAGIRDALTANFFGQFKVVYHRNDRPASGREKDDLQFLLGVGWAF